MKSFWKVHSLTARATEGRGEEGKRERALWAARGCPHHPAVTVPHRLQTLENNKDPHSAQEGEETQWRLSDGPEVPEQAHESGSEHPNSGTSIRPATPSPALHACSIRTMQATLAHTGSQATDRFREED